MCESTSVSIIDSTLREGEQTPGTAFDNRQKRKIIHLLAELGVDEIELGVAAPCFSGLPAFVQEARQDVGGRSRLALWCRCRAADIAFAAACSPDVLSLSIPVSDLHIHHKLRCSRNKVLEMLGPSIRMAVDSGIPFVSVGLEDATRTDNDFLAEVVIQAEAAGAFRVRLADTVGVATPGTISDLVRMVRSHCSGPIGVHTHNDFGMATANAVAALEAGARWADATVLGLGERAGNCRLEELVGYLALIRGGSRYSPQRLPALCGLVAEAADIEILRNHPVVGRDVFTCETGLHLHGLSVNPKTYEPFDPERIGRSRTLRFGGKTGKRAVRNSLSSMGVDISDQAAAKVVSRLRQMAREGKNALNATELLNLVGGKDDIAMNICRPS